MDLASSQIHIEKKYKIWTIHDLEQLLPQIDLSPDIVLRPYQKEGILFLLNNEERHRGSILAHEMGLGKTLQTLILIKITNILYGRQTTLILCPLQVSDNWVKEAKRLFSNIPSMLQFKNGERGIKKWVSYKQKNLRVQENCISPEMVTKKTIEAHDIVICHYDGLRIIWEKKVIQPLNEILNKQKNEITMQNLEKKEKLELIANKIPELRWPKDKKRSDEKILDAEIKPELATKLLGPVLSYRYRRCVADESHNLKNPACHRATMVYAISCEHRILLSGTPKINEDGDTWSQFHILRVKNLPSKKEFMVQGKQCQDFEKRREEYIKLTKTGTIAQFMSRNEGSVEYQSYQYIQNLYKKYIHRVAKKELKRKEDVAESQTSKEQKQTDNRYRDEVVILEKSDTVRSSLSVKYWHVDMPDYFIQLYENIRIGRLQDSTKKDNSPSVDKKSGLRLQLSGSEKNNKENTYLFASMQLLIQFCCDPVSCIDKIKPYCKDPHTLTKVQENVSPKFQLALEYIQTRTLPEEKILIFCYYIEACNNLAKFLDSKKVGKCIVITGKVTSDLKTKLIKEFQEKTTYRIMIATMCLTEGVTLHRANHVIFLTLWWNKSKENQAVARVHRMGQKKNVHVAYLIASGSIDEKVKEVSEGKGTIPTTSELKKILSESAPDAIKKHKKKQNLTLSTIQNRKQSLSLQDLEAIEEIEDIEEIKQPEQFEDIEEVKQPEQPEDIEEVKQPQQFEDIEEIKQPEQPEDIEEIKQSEQFEDKQLIICQDTPPSQIGYEDENNQVNRHDTEQISNESPWQKKRNRPEPEQESQQSVSLPDSKMRTYPEKKKACLYPNKTKKKNLGWTRIKSRYYIQQIDFTIKQDEDTTTKKRKNESTDFQFDLGTIPASQPQQQQSSQEVFDQSQTDIITSSASSSEENQNYKKQKQLWESSSKCDSNIAISEVVQAAKTLYYIIINYIYIYIAICWFFQLKII